MEIKKLSESIQLEIDALFVDIKNGLSEREDSRAFGAMIERRIVDNWSTVCNNLGYSELDRPGRRTIYDLGMLAGSLMIGVDVKTKDLDDSKYSDGGFCAVGNLLKFLTKPNVLFLVAEVGHKVNPNKGNLRDLQYIKVTPFSILPKTAYRIENLGTGQVRLNQSINEIWDDLEWDRQMPEFYEMFGELARSHYVRVIRDSLKRIEYLDEFAKSGYTELNFK